MKKRLLILPIIAGLMMAGCDTKKPEQPSGDTPSGEEVASVVSVSVSSPKGKIYTNTEAFTLTATVTVTGNASKSVQWKSSDTSLAIVTAGGKVTPKAPGTVTITATSTFDSTKSGSVSFTINDAGYAGDLIAEGYDFVPSWPAEEIKALAGVDGFAITDTKGFYVDAGTTEQGVKYVCVACDASEENEAQIEEAVKDFGYYYDSYYDMSCFIDPTISYEVDIYPTYADEAETQPVYMFDFYESTAYFEGSKEDTADTAWNAETVANLAKVGEGFTVPFVKLGDGYVSEYDEGELYIYDQSPDYKKLEGYEELFDESYEKIEDEQGVYFKKDINKYSFAVIEFGFESGYGNIIAVTTYLKDLEEYPAAEVAAFVDAIPSKFEVTEFTSENGVYTYEEATIKVGEEEKDCIFVGVYDATTSECMAFIGSLVADGFDIKEQSTAAEEAEGYKFVTLQKGKIVLNAELSYVRDATQEEIEEFGAYIDSLTDEQFEELSDEDYYKYLMLMFTGSFSVVDLEANPEARLTVYGDLKGREEPGLYVDSANQKVSMGKTLNLGVEPFELGENPTISYVSSNPEVATVDEEGVVTPVAVGTATVTASTDYNEKHYEVDIIVQVVNEVTDSITYSKIFSESIGTNYTDFKDIKDASDAVYAGQCAGSHDSIQIRSKNSNSGIYSATSGGTIKEVSIEFNSNDTSTKAIKIIASNTQFESMADAFAGTVVATLTQDSEGKASYTFTEDYAYVAVISADGAHYLDAINFVWAA